MGVASKISRMLHMHNCNANSKNASAAPHYKTFPWACIDRVDKESLLCCTWRCYLDDVEATTLANNDRGGHAVQDNNMPNY